MSDRIAILRAGEIVQVGTPDEIYTRPNSKFVSEFMGEINTLKVERTGKAASTARRSAQT